MQHDSGTVDTAKRQQLFLVWKLSVPAILAQITSIVMQSIDAAMMGSLGAGDALVPGILNLVSIWGK